MFQDFSRIVNCGYFSSGLSSVRPFGSRQSAVHVDQVFLARDVVCSAVSNLVTTGKEC